MNDAVTTKRPEPQRAEPRPHPLTPAMQQLIASLALCVAFLALCVAVAGLSYTVWTASNRTNDRLVAIGISVLRTDPEKYPQMKTAREWALDLIDANAGDVKFSDKARAILLEKPLPAAGGTEYEYSDTPLYRDTPLYERQPPRYERQDPSPAPSTQPPSK